MSKHTEGVDPTKPVGYKNPPKRTQFGAPDAPPRGTKWKKADSPRYKLEKMIQLTIAEIEDLRADTEAPLFERRLAQAIYEADWKTLEHIINQVYGPPVQRIEQTIEQPKPLISLEDIKSKARKLNEQAQQDSTRA